MESSIKEAKVIAIANQKGGSGKTTTAVNLGAWLSQNGSKVLVVDLDPQSNLSIGLGVPIDKISHSIYDVMIDRAYKISSIICSCSMPDLDIAPSTIHLSGAEIELVNVIGRENVLKTNLIEVIPKYDYILIDCPPSLGLLTLNALNAAKEIIIPVEAHFFALAGLGQLLNTIRIVKEELNPDLKIFGILTTMYQTGAKLSEQVLDELKEHFSDLLFETIIVRNIKLAEAPSHGQPILTYAPTSSGAKCYSDLGEEILKRVHKK